MSEQDLKLYHIMGNDRGAVLIMVLIILIAIIIIGISVMRTTVIENAIAGNERVVLANFNLSESGIDFAIRDYASYTSTLGLDGTYNYNTTGELPSNISSIDELTVRFKEVTGTPRAGEDGTRAPAYSKGGVNNMEARHYLIEAREGNETIQAGILKIVPGSIQD